MNPSHSMIISYLLTFPRQPSPNAVRSNHIYRSCSITTSRTLGSSRFLSDSPIKHIRYLKNSGRSAGPSSRLAPHHPISTTRRTAPTTMLCLLLTTEGFSGRPQKASTSTFAENSQGTSKHGRFSSPPLAPSNSMVTYVYTGFSLCYP